MGAPNSVEIPVVADLQCDYLAQIMYDEKLRVHVKINEVGSSSIDIHYLGINEKQVPVFTGRGAIVQISRKSGRPAKWNEELKQQLNNFSDKARV